MLSSRLLGLSLTMVAAFAVTLRASEFLVVTRSPSGVWSLQHGEVISVNGKEKVRRASAAAGNPATWDSKAIGRLQNVDIDSFAVIRRAPDGAFLGRETPTQEWQALLPDGTKTQTAETPANLWNGAALLLKQDKKDKDPASIRAESVYAIVTGGDAASAAASFVSAPALHMTPGVDDAQAFRNAIGILAEAVKVFPTGPATDRMREYVRAGMAERLRTWSNGDAPIGVLDESKAFADVSEATFPADARLSELRRQTRDTARSLDRKIAILRALDAGKQSDAFLLAYRDFEPFDKSFTDLSAARQAHLKSSAVFHAGAAQRARAAGDFANAIRHLRIAQWRDPRFTEAANALEEVRLEVARLSSQQFAETRKNLDPRSPKQVQLQRRLLMAEQYLNDSKALEAENALKEAEGIDKDEPKIKFLDAKVAVLRGDLGRALALLDLYAGLAITNQDFDEGEKLRASVQYKIENQRKESESKLAGLSSEQRFATALEIAASGLKLDNEDTHFLFQTGMNACVLRNCEPAAPLLRRFLDITDSSEGKREERMAALRLLRRASAPTSTQPPARLTVAASAVSWFSGAPLDAGVFYDPVSLAFQPKIARVKGSKSLTVSYEWSGEQLKSVHTRYEDKKTASNIVKLAAAGAAASQGIGSTVGWRTADRETNDFYFNYYDDVPQVLKVSRDNVITKSRKIPITIPGIGGFGGLGMLTGGMGGALGGLRGGNPLASLAPGGGSEVMRMMGGFGGVSGFGGVGGSGALRALVTSRSMGMSGGMSPGNLAEMFRQSGPSQTASIHADPQGGTTLGYLNLWNSPRLDTELAYQATGKRVAVAFSGNSYFHPFVWDAIHLFELDYDEQGRVRHAWELDNPGAPRLDFTWEGRRLMQITGRSASGDATVYSRTMQYSGDKLIGESIAHSGKPSRIKYKYDKQDRLIEADCEEDQSLDGRSRQIEFLVDNPKGGKR